MCGIVGYVGTKNIPGRAHFALDVVLEGLRRLEYRGYDSAGIAVLDEGKISFRKKAGKVAALDEVIAADPLPQAVVGIQGIAEHPDVVGLFWGAEDLTVLLGGTHSRFMPDEGAPDNRPGPYRDTMRLTRALMHIHAAAAGKFTIDAVHADFHDQQGMFEEAVDAARSGFAGSACIHPKQVETVRRAYRPEPAQVEWALRVVDESQHYPGAFKLDGEMVDAPLIAQAHRVLARAHGAG